jgi:hypothetical protein
MTGFVVLSVFVLLIVAALAMLIRNLFTGTDEPAPDRDWLETFSAARYRPMLRLLADNDYEFMLATGADPAVVRRLRAERRRIFRTYLKNLVRDFNRIHRAARIVLMESEQDQPELAARLIRTRLEFQFAVFAVRGRLALHAVGIGVVDVQRLLGAVESVRTHFGNLQPVRQSAAL